MILSASKSAVWRAARTCTKDAVDAATSGPQNSMLCEQSPTTGPVSERISKVHRLAKPIRSAGHRFIYIFEVLLSPNFGLALARFISLLGPRAVYVQAKESFFGPPFYWGRSN